MFFGLIFFLFKEALDYRNRCNFFVNAYYCFQLWHVNGFLLWWSDNRIFVVLQDTFFVIESLISRKLGYPIHFS